MRKSPGFDVGHWLKYTSRCPRFCAACISETIRSCAVQPKPKKPNGAFAKNFLKLTENLKKFFADTLKVI